MLKLIEYLVKILFQYLPIIVLTIVLLTIGYGLLLRVLRLKINNPFLQWLINLLGLHFLDTSQISLEFHSYLKLVCNYSKKIILNIEPDELSHHLVGNQYPGGGYQKVIWSVLGDTIFLTFNRSLFFSDDWFKLAKLLLCYRKAQPINGLILGTTVADSLEGSKVSTRLSLFDRCTQYPVYFVLVDGKKLGELTLPTESMMGWSCDKPPEKALYSPTEISQLLNTVKVHIISVFEQLNLHTTTVTSLAVSKSIADWTDKQLTLFNSLFYNDLPLFLRGVYVMDLETQTGEQLVALVCQENLATPSNQPRTKYANIIYNLFLALGLVLYLTLPLFYKQLLHEAGNLTVLWNNLISMNSKPNMTLENNIMDLARHLKTLNDNDLSFGTIPASWGSNLYSKIRSKLVEVYNFTLIHRIINTFNQNLTQTLLDTYPYKLPAFTCTSPIDTIELHQLYYFIKHLEELKNFQNLILNLIGSDNLTAFNDCVWHVTGQELPKEFFKNVNLYVKAKQKNLPTVKKIEDSLSILEQLLEKKVNNFFDSIGGTGIQKIVTDLTDNLLFLQKNPTYY